MCPIKALPAAFRAALMAVAAAGLMVAVAPAHAAKDKAMCEGLSGALLGLCSAGAALGCGVDASNANACGKLADKFEGIAGAPPPWEDPVDPPPPTGTLVDLILDFDGFDLDAETKCAGYALGNPCLTDEGIDDTDFWTYREGDIVVFALVDACSTFGVNLLSKVVVKPYADVVAADADELDLGVAEEEIGDGQTLIIRTCLGNTFKIGNRQFIEGTGSVRLEFELL